MRSLSSLIRRLAAPLAVLATAATLAACAVETTTVEYGGGFDGPRPRPTQYCGFDSPPVCGVRGRDQQTFANACEARTSGYDILGPGECRRQRPYPGEGRACTREYAPVCGVRGRDQQTFANACEARNSGYDVAGRGECQVRRPVRGDDGWREPGQEGWDRPDDRRGDYGDRPRDRNDDQMTLRPGRDDRGGDRQRPRNERACTMDYKPVCAARGDSMKTFGNSCAADVAGYSVIRPGECSGR